jgi:hypothetical protein
MAIIQLAEGLAVAPLTLFDKLFLVILHLCKDSTGAIDTTIEPDRSNIIILYIEP